MNRIQNRFYVLDLDCHQTENMKIKKKKKMKIQIQIWIQDMKWAHLSKLKSMVF